MDLSIVSPLTKVCAPSLPPSERNLAAKDQGLPMINGIPPEKRGYRKVANTRYGSGNPVSEGSNTRSSKNHSEPELDG
jgi:hypothetical protein